MAATKLVQGFAGNLSRRKRQINEATPTYPAPQKVASYPGLLRRRDKAWYPLFAHARVAVEFHRRRLSSYTFAVRDEYSSVFLAVREALLFAIYSDDCIVSSFLEALAQ